MQRYEICLLGAVCAFCTKTMQETNKMRNAMVSAPTPVEPTCRRHKSYRSDLMRACARARVRVRVRARWGRPSPQRGRVGPGSRGAGRVRREGKGLNEGRDGSSFLRPHCRSYLLDRRARRRRRDFQEREHARRVYFRATENSRYS